MYWQCFRIVGSFDWSVLLLSQIPITPGLTLLPTRLRCGRNLYLTSVYGPCNSHSDMIYRFDFRSSFFGQYGSPRPDIDEIKGLQSINAIPCRRLVWEHDFTDLDILVDSIYILISIQDSVFNSLRRHCFNSHDFFSNPWKYESWSIEFCYGMVSVFFLKYSHWNVPVWKWDVWHLFSTSKFGQFATFDIIMF